MLRNLKWFCLIFVSVLMFSSSTIKAASLDNAWRSLSDGKAVAIMRHALAPGISDPAGFSLTDCQTQRNLSDAGRVQSNDIGDLFRSQGIEQAQVYSSEWCRCMDTAALLELGDVEPLPALNSIFENRSATEAQTEAMMKKLRGWLAAPAEPVVLVSHQVNIQALTQTNTSSGEILIITLKDDAVVVLTSIPTE